jgi:hypothetical protein
MVLAVIHCGAVVVHIIKKRNITFNITPTRKYVLPKNTHARREITSKNQTTTRKVID